MCSLVLFLYSPYVNESEIDLGIVRWGGGPTIDERETSLISVKFSIGFHPSLLLVGIGEAKELNNYAFWFTCQSRLCDHDATGI
jgi:hypothetical protein